MTVLVTPPASEQQRNEQAGVHTVRVTHATWTVSEAEHSHGVPQRPGIGARLAVRKYWQALNKLAAS